MAHLGRQISDNTAPTLSQVIGYVMQLGFVCLLSALVAEQLQISSTLWQSATAATLAVSAREIIPWLTGRAKSLLEAFGFNL